jgi:hypothetical protein
MLCMNFWRFAITKKYVKAWFDFHVKYFFNLDQNQIYEHAVHVYQSFQT